MANYLVGLVHDQRRSTFGRVRTPGRVRTGLGSTRLRRASDRAEWQQFASADGWTAFHGWDFLTAVAPAFGCRFVPLLVTVDGAAVGVAPLLLRRKGGVQTANIVPFDLGPVVAPQHLTGAAQLLKRWALRRRVVSLRLAVHPDGAAVAGQLAAAGLTESPDPTFLIDLVGRSTDEIFAALPSKTRTSIRSSARKGVVVRESTAEEVRQVLPRLHEQALGGPKSYADELGRRLAADDTVPTRTATAELDGEAIGISVTVGGTNAAGWVGAVEREHQNTAAMTALVWDSVVWAHGQGYPWLDMLGAPDAGIAAFKRRFAPRVVEHPSASWELPGLARLRSRADDRAA